jgi:hypothetical protein
MVPTLAVYDAERAKIGEAAQEGRAYFNATIMV